MPGKNGWLSMKCQTSSTSDFACFANWGSICLELAAGTRAASRPWQAWAICPRGSSRLQAGSGGEPWTTCWGAGGRPWGQLRGGVGEKIGETAAKPGTPQLPRTIQRCCPNISRSLQMTFAWLTVRVLDNVAVQTPWEAERYTIIGNDWQPRGSLN